MKSVSGLTCMKSVSGLTCMKSVSGLTCMKSVSGLTCMKSVSCTERNATGLSSGTVVVVPFSCFFKLISLFSLTTLIRVQCGSKVS